MTTTRRFSLRRLAMHLSAAALATMLSACVARGAQDPAKAVLYVHVQGANLVLLADEAIESQEDYIGLLEATHAEMRAGLAATRAGGDVRTADALAGTVEQAGRAVAVLKRTLPEVNAAREAASRAILRAPLVQAQLAEVVRGMAGAEAGASQINLANRQIVLADRMSRRLVELLEGGDAAVTAADALKRDLHVFAQVAEGLDQGSIDAGIARVDDPAARAALAKVLELHAETATDAQAVMAQGDAIAQARGAVEELHDLRMDLLEAAPPAY